MIETVNHPPHYGGADNPYEVIKVLEAWLTRDEFIGAMKFNIQKYLARANAKNGSEDYAKASWYSAYLDGYIKRHPAPEKIDGAVAKQLSRSMELNAKLKNAIRDVIAGKNVSTIMDPTVREALEAALKLS